MFIYKTVRNMSILIGAKQTTHIHLGDKSLKFEIPHVTFERAFYPSCQRNGHASYSFSTFCIYY